MKNFRFYIVILILLFALIGSTPANAKWWGNSNEKIAADNSDDVDMEAVVNGEYSFDEKKKDDYVFPLDNNQNPFMIKDIQKNQVNALQEAIIEKSQPYSKPDKVDMQAFSRDLDLTSDTVDFYTETSQYVGKGNARLLVLKEQMEMTANEIIIDQRNYEIIGIGNVRILKNGSEYFGDYIRINTKKESSFFDNPILYYPEITINANAANMYTNEMVVKKGSASIWKKAAMIISTSKAGNLREEKFFEPKREFDDTNDRYKIVAKKVIVKRGEDRTDITLRSATIYRGKHKVAYSPVFSMTTDKDVNYVETIFPEVGNRSRIGTYIAPAVVLALPNASTLKAGPLVSMDTDKHFGLGAFARLSTPNSMTDFMYSSATGKFLIDGSYEFTKHLRFNFVGNDHMDNGWMGGQMPNYGGEFVYEKMSRINQANAAVRNRLSMGLFQDNLDYRRGKGTTTLRYKWQASVYNMKPLLNWEKYLMLGYAYEHDLALYQTGQTHGVARVGPRIYTDLGRLFAELTYFVGSESGESPFVFDRYRYGKNNLRFRGQYYICKYLSLGYYASANIGDKDFEGRWLTENQFVAAVGTDDLKVRIGFDTVRNSAVVGLDMMLGTNKAVAEFDEMKVIDFDSDAKQSRHITEKQRTNPFINWFKKGNKNDGNQNSGTENPTEDNDLNGKDNNNMGEV